MKKTIIVSLLSVLALKAAFSQGISFEQGTWKEVQQKAQKENKFIFVDAYTEWCGPCKWMAKNIFTNDTVGEFYNKNFVNYKLDMEKGEGREFAKKYNVKSYPTYLFFNEKGELVHRSLGSKAAKKFIEDGKNALDPQKQSISLKKRYDAGERNPTFLKEYLSAVSVGGTRDEKELVLKEYLSLTPKNELFTQEGFSLISNSSFGNIRSEGFKFVLDNKEEYKKVDSTAMNFYIYAALMNQATNYGLFNDKNQLDSLKQVMKPIVGEKFDKYAAEMDVSFYRAAKDTTKEYTSTVAFVERYGMNDPETLNNQAWYIFENSSNKKKLEKALSWSKKSVELKPEWYILDTYANLLFKLNRTEEAKQWAEKAIAKAKEKGEDASETEKLLEKIKSQKK